MAKNNEGTSKRQRLTDKLRTFGRTNVRYTIGVRFLIFVALVALFSGGIVGLVMVNNSRTYLSQQALQNNLNQANLAAAFASNYIKAIEAHVQVFATRPDVRQAVLDGTPQQLQKTLAAFVEIQTPLNGVGIYDTNGIQLTFSLAGSTTIGQSFANRDWFQGVMAAGKPYLGPPLLAKANNVPASTYAVPILDDQGQIRAILTGGISLQSLSEALVNIGFSSDTRALMIDIRDGGLIIADKDPTLLLKPVIGDKEAVSRLLVGQSGALETTDSNGKLDLTGFAPVTDLPWGVIVITPRNAAFAMVNSLTYKASFYAGLIILASAILGGVFVLQITRPIRHLVEATKEIGSGNLDFKVDRTGKNEVGDLSRAFSDMTLKLKNTMVSRDELIKEVIERKQAEEALQSMTAYQSELLASIPDIVMEEDNNKVYTWANQAGREFFGEDVIGKEAAFYFEGEQDAAVKRLFTGEESTFYVESWQRRKDGQKRLLAWWCRALKDNQGNVKGALSSAQDITERKQVEESLVLNSRRQQVMLQLNRMTEATPQEIIDFALEEAVRLTQSKIGYLAFLNEDESVLTMHSWSKSAMAECAITDKPFLYPVVSTGLWGEAVRQRRPIITNDYAAANPLKKGIPVGHVGLTRHMNVPVFDGLRMVLVAGVGNKTGEYDEGDVQQLTLLMEGMWRLLEHKRSEKILLESEMRYRRLFEAARDGILILDTGTGTVVDVNPFMVEMLGFSREEFLDKKIWELGFLKDIVANKDNFEELKRQKYIKYENLALETATGKRILVEFVSHLYEVGNQQVIQCNIRDISERRRLEEERDKFTKELAEKNTELERFTYTVSHDLKSPLVTVKTFLGYLKQDIAGSDAERIKKDMLFMNGAADKMGNLLGELLEMSRVGRIVNPSLEVTFIELARETLSMVAGPIAEKGVQVQVRDDAVTLYGDRSRLVEIWQNLIENAVKFMDDQPSPQIDIGVEHHENETVFFVGDNGIGIEPQYQSKLFNLFEKINPRTEGTGMGLAIAKRIVELYHGRIWVDSKGLGQGSCFRFTLPGALKDKEKGV